MKIGFCCKWIGPETDVNITGTTAQWCRNHPSERDARLRNIATSNLVCCKNLMQHVAQMPPELRMCRIGSDVFPLFTHPECRSAYPYGIHDWAEQLEPVGATARLYDIRLSFHPGEHIALASDKPDVITRSLEDIEYHAALVTAMGYTEPHSCKIVVHVSGKSGIPEFRRSFHRLSLQAQRQLVVENDEYQFGIEQLCAELGDLLPVVPDLHHQRVKSLLRDWNMTDHIMAEVVKTWRGQRPVMHYSQSATPLGQHRAALRSHCYTYHDINDVDAVLQRYTPFFDIQCEAKGKNLAQQQVYVRAQKLGIV